MVSIQGELTATMLCYLINLQLKNIGFADGKETFKEIVELALLNFFNDINNLSDDDLKEFILVNNPNGLGEFEISLNYRDDLTQANYQQKPVLMTMGETQ